MKKLLLLLTILLLCTNCTQYKKKYLHDDSDIESIHEATNKYYQNPLLKTSPLIVNNNKNTYRINNFVSLNLNTPNAYRKYYPKAYFTQSVINTIAENPAFSPISVPFALFLSPLLLLGDVGVVLESRGGDRDLSYTKKKVHLEKEPLNCSSDLSISNNDVNYNFLYKIGVIDNMPDSSLIQQTTINETTPLTKFTNNITEDYLELNNLKIKPYIQKTELTLTKENINKLNNQLIYLFSNLNKLCNNNLPSNIKETFASKTQHVFLNYGINKEHLIKSKVNGEEIFIIDKKSSLNETIKYTSYGLNPKLISNNLEQIIDNSSDTRLVSVMLFEHSSNYYNTREKADFNAKYYSYNITDSATTTFLKNFNNKKIKAFFQKIIKEQIPNSKIVIKGYDFYFVPNSDTKIQVKLNDNDKYFAFDKEYILKKDNSVFIVTDFFRKQDYKNYYSKIDSKLIFTPKILIQDSDSLVSINPNKIVSKQCDSINGDVTEKYLQKISYHKEPIIQNYLYKYAKKLYNKGQKFKSSMTAYCDVRAEDHYPFQGNIKINVNINTPEITFYLPLILSNTNNTPYYKIY